MKRVVTTVSAFSMALALLAAVGSGADAQSRRDRNAAAQPAQPAITRPFATAYQPVNAAINASNWAAADAALPALRAAASTPYERFVAAQTDYRIANGQQNSTRLAAAVTAMLDSGGAPADQQQRLYLAGAQIAYNAQDFPNAAARAKRAIELGATDDVVTNLMLSSYFRANQLDQGVAEARRMIAAADAQGRHAPEAVYSLTAVALQNANRKPELADLLVQRATAYPSELNFRSAALVYLDVTRPEDRGRTVDALRLIRAANAMNARPYYLELVQDLSTDALYNELIETVAAGRAARLINTPDANFDELVTAAQSRMAEDRRTLPGSEARGRAAADAGIAVRVADAYLSYGEFARAEELYTLALGKPGADAAKINTRIGITRFRAGNFAGAVQAFNRVDGTRAPLGKLWAALAQSRLTPPAAAPAPATPAAPAAH